MVLLEAAAIISIVGWVAAPVFSRLIGKARSYALNKYKWHKDLPKKLENLAQFLDEISSTVSLVESRRIHNHSMVCWLSQLKGAIDDVDDFFDHLDYEILRSANNNLPDEDNPNAGGQSSRTAAAAFEPSSTVSIGSAESVSKLNALLKKLNDIRQSSRGLVQASMLAVAAGCSDSRRRFGGASRPVTGPSLPMDMQNLPYCNQYKKLLRWLLPDQEKLDDDGYHDRSVVAIIGHGGMGKTTLAQRAWNDPDVKNRFDLWIWASVYNKFGEADLLGEIWRSAVVATNTQNATAHYNEMMSFSSIQQALEELVASKRYLLVLDDVCNDEMATELQRSETWSDVLAPFFRHGERGSKVLLTTRAMICAQTMGVDPKRTMVVSGIDHESFIDLLKSTAGDVETFRARELQEALSASPLLSKKSASPWTRSPLSAKEMGIKLMRNINNMNKWAEILATDCHENAIAVHLSSYQQLPPHLQYCLAFLSLFPNNFEFQRGMLVKMWIAHGFVNEDGLEGERTMEDTAGGYLDDLLARSFFLQDINATPPRYAVHEHIHSMIRSVSANHFLMIHGNFAPANIPLTVRHLSVVTTCLACLAQLKKHGTLLNRLRTFLVPKHSSTTGTPCAHERQKDSATTGAQDKKTDPSTTGRTPCTYDKQKGSSSTRVTPCADDEKTADSSTTGTPCTVQNKRDSSTTTETPCKHEQKKDSSKPLISIDKDLLRELHGVRVLDLSGTDIETLPPEIGSLIHLRYLALPDTIRLLPREFGKLFHLQTLIGSNGAKATEARDLAFKFVCAKESSPELLGGMNSLRGSLSITGLDAVATKEDAQKAQLRKKKSVKVLKFEWDARDEAIPPGSDVLEALEPPTGIQVLQIRWHRGTSAPTWLCLANNILEQLTHLYIINCRKWSALPHFGHLPRLKHLHIKDMKFVEEIDGSGPFKSLETLVLSDMPNLARWIAEAARRGYLILKRTEILDCPKLCRPPPLPPTLKVLKVRNCLLLQPILKRPGLYQKAELDLDF